MAKIRVIEYEGADEQILKILTQGIPQGHAILEGSSHAERTPEDANPSVWEAIAKKFHKHVSDTAAWGRASQNMAMVAWLRSNGKIDLTSLWKAAGVKAQHDFGGVGGSLTKNMQKAGGPREWYRSYRNEKGQWNYEIVDELVKPLKSAFGLK